MSNEHGTSDAADSPLRSLVVTGRDNRIRVLPYQVLNLSGPETWDPESEGLALSYRVNNPHGRARRGRILYYAPPVHDAEEDSPNAEPIVIHTQPLSTDQFTHGSHGLPESDRWDGSISEGLEDRERVAADLSPVHVVIEIWNSDEDAPGTRGEIVSRFHTNVRLDVISRAEWENHFVIPHDDPDELEHGAAFMDIQVRNVEEGTPVRIMVARINQIDDPDTDFAYEATGRQPSEQPGLEDLQVDAEGRVMMADGNRPEVIFLNFQEHWKHPGNNFYCFYLAFGDRGGYMVASERDYENQEEDCLHMRFTVFIHRPATNLPQYTTYANSLYRFFRNDTDYFRPYIMRGGPDYLEDWLYHYQHRYIVIFLGHAYCGCSHGDHPKNSRGDFRPLYDRAFDPDQNRCPPEIYDTDEARAAVAREERRDRRPGGAFSNWPEDEPLYGGCGHKSHVKHRISLERLDNGRDAVFGNVPGREERNALGLGEVGGSAVAVSMQNTVPRFCFFNGGCRTMLTTNLGEHFTQNPSENRTRFYHGWVYSPGCDYGRFCYDIFTRWLQGTDADPAPQVPDTARFMDAYRWAANQGNRAAHQPRLMDTVGRTTLHLAPMAAEDAMS